MHITHWGLDKIIRHDADNIFKYILLNEIYRILFKISLEMVPGGSNWH